MEIPNNCGTRIPGKPWIPTPPGPQFCGTPLPGGRGWQASRDVTDPCGRPIPQFCSPADVLQPVCYRLPTFPPGCVAQGFVRIQQSVDCSADQGVVVDANNTPIPGAIQVPCGAASALPNFPTP